MEENDNSLFRLRWDAQRSALLGSVATLFREEAFIDTTIFTDGKIFKAHRLLLSASSPYLKHILQSVPGDHAVLVLPHINSNDFGNVLKFIYEGEIKISQKDLKSFLQVSRLLKIKGMDFEDEDYVDDVNEPENIYKPETAASKPAPKDPLRTRPSTTTTANNHESRSNSDRYSASSQHEHDPDDYVNVAATAEHRRAELEFSKSHVLDYDDKDGLHLGEEDDEPDNSDMLDDGEEECHDDGFPLQPEISMMEVTGDSFHMKNDMGSDMQIISSQGQSSPGSSWNIPHSSTSSNHRGSSSGYKPHLKKALTRAPGEGILMRMMREPLKSSMSSASPHSHSHPGYEIDESGFKQRTKRYVQCTSCSKVLSSLSALKRHMEDVHCARIQGKCLICGRVYSSRNSLLTHVYSAHKKHHDYKAVARIIRESDFETFATT